MNIIFVCTGNTCRSPMAEYYLKSKNLDDINIISRGFSCGEVANPKAVLVMNEVNIDISNHISNCITTTEAANADAIICMTESHRQLLMSYGVNKERIIVLSGGIDDPFGYDIDTYRRCRDSIFKGIDNLIRDGFFNTFTIDYATHNDVDSIASIEKECFSTPWSENSIQESMNAGTSFYVARKGNIIVGYMGVSKIAGEGYVTNVAILPEHRRKGIGKALLQYVIDDCKDNLEFISLEVRVSNISAISLYEKVGFEKVGLRKRFYTHPDEDAIIMTKTFL